ncbi:alpha/beta hydrolase [Ferrimicrobium sp.]|uniref:alpha/beta fold hydrolase n=1 Tax=Ferrimicrobium sp. TaxID=2926050 RepID=UPI00263783DD|nr:alpha/beta hydrolase [Ferrimicrobium sp.]
MRTTSTIQHLAATLEVAHWSPNLESRDGPTIFLLHEGLGCVEMWKDFPQRLADRLRLPVIAYSRAGYGGSSTIDLPRSLDYMQREADEVLPDLLQALCGGPRVLLGHSDGASIALAYAGAQQDPLLTSVVVIAPHVVVEAIAIAAIQGAKEQFTAGALAAKLARYHRSNLSSAFWGWNDAWLDPDFRTFSILDRLDTIDVPVLALQGTEDEYGTSMQLELIASRVAETTLTLIREAKHSPHLTHTDRVLDAIECFLAQRGILVPNLTGSPPG